MKPEPTKSVPAPAPDDPSYYFRFHIPHLHLGSVFGDDWFSLKAEAFRSIFWDTGFSCGTVTCGCRLDWD